MGGHGENGQKGVTPGMIGRTAMWVVGGACAGAGILTAISTRSFGVPGDKDVAQTISTLGYDGVNNLVIADTGYIAIGLILSGVAILAAANVGAWKETGGY